MPDLWDLKAPWYGRLRQWGPFGWILNRELANSRRLLSDVLQARRPALHVAAGPRLNLELPSAAGLTVGMDASIRMLKRAKTHGLLLAVQADVVALPFATNSFRLVIAVGISEYVDRHSEFARELARVLSSGGHLLVTCAQPNAWNAMRLILGHRLNLATAAAFQKGMEGLGLRILSTEKSLMQTQMLFVS